MGARSVSHIQFLGFNYEWFLGVGSGGGRDGSGHGGGSSDVEVPPVAPKVSTSLPESNANATYYATPLPSLLAESQKDLSASPQLHRCNTIIAERSSAIAIMPVAHEEGDPDKA